ncbi:MAG: hypothetical protein HYZ53_27945 [Planctomycetes bacterium]|nr:hypothetical protein [Planctomycetota bacterium]
MAAADLPADAEWRVAEDFVAAGLVSLGQVVQAVAEQGRWAAAGRLSSGGRGQPAGREIPRPPVTTSSRLAAPFQLRVEKR